MTYVYKTTMWISTKDKRQAEMLFRAVIESTPLRILKRGKVVQERRVSKELDTERKGESLRC